MLAPFEGVQRRSGYAALDAMRAAIAEMPVRGWAVMPLALDDSADPARSAAKLRQDPTVGAVIGPLISSQMGALQTSLAADWLWLTPFAVNENGFVDPRDEQWQLDWLRAVARLARTSSAKSVALAGWQASGWQLDPAQVVLAVGEPLAWVATVDELQPSDVVLWLGDAEQGARLFTEVRSRYPEMPFWLGLAGSDPVLAERAVISGPVYWATWLPDDHQQWARAHPTLKPSGYLIYAATQAAIRSLEKQLTAPKAQLTEPQKWQMVVFQLAADGTSNLVPLTHFE